MLAKKDQRDCKRQRAVSPEFALVLEKVLGTTAEMWLRIQAEYGFTIG